jgi:3-mercaptopyruvate sulfurtransferase SseA
MKGTKKFVLVLVAISITIGALWITHRSVSPREASWEDVAAEAKSGGYRLITTEELSRQYQNQPNDILLVDTRQEWEYRTGHIKGALNFPIEPTWLSRWRNKQALESLLGPDKNRLIVFY